MPAKILLAGEGGQGVQVVAKIIAIAAQKSNKNATYLPSFGVEQRGGVSVAYVQISQNPINYPRFDKANIIVSFSNRSVESVKDFINERTLLIFDNSAIYDKNIFKLKETVKNYLAVSAVQTAKAKFTTRVTNMILLGALSAQLKDIPHQEFEKAIIKEFASKIAKNPSLQELNLNAFNEGVKIAESFDQSRIEFKGAEEKDIVRAFNKDEITWQRYPEYCKGCALCIARCPAHALTFSNDLNFLGTPSPIVDMDKCTGCGQCMNICPDAAIKVENDN